jgi:CPA2 family monovalent cation:H+ antiporter-2
MGISLGQINQEILHTIILTMIITIFLSTYMVTHSQKFYEKMKWFAKIFEKKGIKRGREGLKGKSYYSMLFGYNRIGFSILNSLKKLNKRYLVIDFNPDTISVLNKVGIPSLYGDVDDADLLDELPLDKVQLVISTVPECETNSVLIETVRRMNRKAIIIVRAHTIDDALELYKKGANYVLTPHFLGGEYVSKMIADLNIDAKGYEKEKEKHIEMLRDVAKRGEQQPKVERN